MQVTALLSTLITTEHPCAHHSLHVALTSLWFALPSWLSVRVMHLTYVKPMPMYLAVCLRTPPTHVAVEHHALHVLHVACFTCTVWH